jgi:O-acetyl-ADP-ribose deacetylase
MAMGRIASADMGALLAVVRGDIVGLDVDAIVNAANAGLHGGGGVDGAIHRAAGPRLDEECAAIGGCPTGRAVVTSGCALRARYVIHAVGPIWAGGDRGERGLLRSCYEEALRLAGELSLRSIAFPNISTGAYGFPKDLAADIAVGFLSGAAPSHPSLREIVLVCYDAENYGLYKARLEAVRLK